MPNNEAVNVCVGEANPVSLAYGDARDSSGKYWIAVAFYVDGQRQSAAVMPPKEMIPFALGLLKTAIKGLFK